MTALRRAPSEGVAERLARIVGAAHVLEDAALRAPYERDWTGRWGGPARVVVRPGDADEVRAAVAVCAAASTAIVPQGGRTGLVGGSVPRGGEVVLSLQRLDRVEDVDDQGGTVVVGAGATLAAVQAAARAAGWEVGVDLGARDSATVGGMVGTNAGGLRVLRHGPMRQQLLGVEAVLADGTRVGRIPGLVKDNSGYHWPSLLAGSEGTLGVVTRVQLALVPALPVRTVAVAGLGSIGDAVRLCGALRRLAPALAAAEVFRAGGLDLVARHRGATVPTRAAWPVYLLAEVAGREDRSAELVAALDEVGAGDVAVAEDAPAARRLWLLREGHTEAIAAEAAARGGAVLKLDVTVPLGAMPAFAAAVEPAVVEAAPGTDVVLFGHLADGNLHVNVLPPHGGWTAGVAERAEELVYDLVLRHRGSISSEHGIGVAKLPWLVRQRGVADVAAMRAIKRALDPRGILNPGVLLPVEGGAARS